LHPNKQVSFAKTIQYQLFHDGVDQNSDEFYQLLAEKHLLNAQDLIQQSKSVYWEKETEKEFEMTKRLQVSGFPALFLVYQNQYYQIAKGFAPFHQVNEIVRKIAGNVD
jgi:protein-disulfide isomerase-like protein with CxxC motif